jgi:hypothetical protein
MEEGYVLNLKSDRRMARKNIFISCLPNYQTNMGVHLKNEKEKHTNIIFVFIIQVIESVVSNAKVKNIYVITLSQNVQPPSMYNTFMILIGYEAWTLLCVFDATPTLMIALNYVIFQIIITVDISVSVLCLCPCFIANRFQLFIG